MIFVWKWKYFLWSIVSGISTLKNCLRIWSAIVVITDKINYPQNVRFGCFLSCPTALGLNNLNSPLTKVHWNNAFSLNAWSKKVTFPKRVALPWEVNPNYLIRPKVHLSLCTFWFFSRFINGWLFIALKGIES